MKRRFSVLGCLWILLVGLCIAGAVAEDELPLEGAAPYPPVMSALSEDGMNYDDGTLTVHITKDMAFDTYVYYVDVTLTDPSQFRTALAAPYPSKKLDKVIKISERNNAVLAINGDFFAYHNDGYVCRQGTVLRQSPRKQRDTLIVDEKGDMTIIVPSTMDNINAFPGEIRQAFCFGPGLIIDGEKQEFNYREKTSCGYPTKAQRLAISQLGYLHYLIIATEGPEQNEPGLSVPELLTLFEPYHPTQVYNLDGGSSASIILCGTKINAPDAKERNVGDIIYFATLVSE